VTWLPWAGLAVCAAAIALLWRAWRSAARDRDIARRAAKIHSEIAAESEVAREVAATACKAWREKYAALDRRATAVDAHADEIAARIDEHAGDVNKVAEDINRELGLE
jgi:hypothetical protein